MTNQDKGMTRWKGTGFRRALLVAVGAWAVFAAAPVRAPYASGALAFSADSAAAGKYTLKAAAAGRATLQQAVDVGGGAAAADFRY